MMIKRMIILSGCIAAAVLHADLVNNPDANTLWIENGRNIQTAGTNSDKGWNNSELEIAPLEDGEGFSLKAGGAKKYRSGRYVPVSKNYPYLVYEIGGIGHTDGKYKAYNVWFQGGLPYGAVSNPQKGIYTFNMYERSNSKTSGREFLRFDLYGLKLDFKYIKVVKTPDYYIAAESPAFAEKQSFEAGDKVKFTVHMKEPAEDVTLRFFDSYTMPQLNLNGADKLQLKPQDEEGYIWSAEVVVESLKTVKGALPKKLILMKAVVLGGGISEPLWGYLAYPFGQKK